jgi:hypothetical protein
MPVIGKPLMQVIGKPRALGEARAKRSGSDLT